MLILISFQGNTLYNHREVPFLHLPEYQKLKSCKPPRLDVIWKNKTQCPLLEVVSVSPPFGKHFNIFCSDLHMPWNPAITHIREILNCHTFRSYLRRTCHVLNILL